jgi:archaellum component FlaD/FlaE
VQWANQSTCEFYKEHCNEVDRKLDLMVRITMKTKGSHGGHGFSLIDNTERSNDDDNQMMTQARTGNRNMDMVTDMEVVRAVTMEITVGVGAMVETVVEVVAKIDVVAVMATEEVATVDVMAVVATEVRAMLETMAEVVVKMDVVALVAMEEVATVDVMAVVATEVGAMLETVAGVVVSYITTLKGNYLCLRA